LRTAFSVSYRVLAPGARRLFRLLGLFPGAEFTAEAAAALLDAPLPQARRLIGALVSAHLIEPAAVGRYRFHDLLREYAQECALVEEAAPDRDAALERVLIWYLNAARTTGGGRALSGAAPQPPSRPPPRSGLGMPSALRARTMAGRGTGESARRHQPCRPPRSPPRRLAPDLRAVQRLLDPSAAEDLADHLADGAGRGRDRE
jgi:hypothetical protein